jgi:hypothetical protein
VTPPEDGEPCSSINNGSASDGMSNTNNTPAAVSPGLMSAWKQDGDFTFTVTAVEDGRQSLRGAPAVSVPRGHFVLVYFTVHNDVLAPRLFAEEYQHLFDGEGRKYDGYIADRGDLCPRGEQHDWRLRRRDAGDPR